MHEAEEKLNSLIAQYRKQLGIRNLEFMCVSGITHLIEVTFLHQIHISFHLYLNTLYERLLGVVIFQK